MKPPKDPTPILDALHAGTLEFSPRALKDVIAIYRVTVTTCVTRVLRGDEPGGALPGLMATATLCYTWAMDHAHRAVAHIGGDRYPNKARAVLARMLAEAVEKDRAAFEKENGYPAAEVVVTDLRQRQKPGKN